VHVLFPHLLHAGDNLGSGCSNGEKHVGDRAGAAVQGSTVLNLTARLLGEEMESDGHQHPPTNGVRADPERRIEGCRFQVGPTAGGDGDLCGVGFDARVDTVLLGEIGAHLQNDVLLSPSWNLLGGGDCVEDDANRQVAVAEVCVGALDSGVCDGYQPFPVPAGVHPVSG